MSVVEKYSPEVGELEAIESNNLYVFASEFSSVLYNELRTGVEMLGTSFRKGVPKIAKGAAFIALSATSGLLIAERNSVDTTLEPHNAKALLTTDGYITADVGGLGSFRKNIEDTPLSFGAKVVIKEVPIAQDGQTEPTERVDLSTESFLESREFNDLKQYLSLFGDPEVQGKNIGEDLRNHYLRWTGLSALVLATGASLFPKKLREEFYNQLDLKTFYKLSVLGILALPLIPQQPNTPKSDGWVKVSSQYDGTPLQGLEIKGEFLRVLVNKYGVEVADYLEEIDQFYSTVEKNLEKAAKVTPLLGSREEDTEYINVLSISDTHCNQFTGRPLRIVTKLSKASVGLANGDLGVSASPWEQMCYDILDDLPDDVGLALANHDYEKVQELVRKRGVTIGNGKINTIGGLPVLSYPDPRKSVFGQGTVYRSNETMEDISEKLALTACASNTKPILQVPLREMAARAVAQGCTDVVFAGDTHNQRIKAISRPANKDAIEFTVGTTSGAGKNQPTFGLPEKIMTWVHVQFEERDDQYIVRAYQEVMIDHKTAEVSIGSIVAVDE